MKLRYLSVVSLLLLLLCVACHQTTTDKSQLDLKDINLIIKSGPKIDSVRIADIQYKESYTLPYTDTVKVDFKRKINDFYEISIYNRGQKFGQRFWFDGEKLLINAVLDGTNFNIESIDSSSLYMASMAYSTKLQQLRESFADSATIDKFLISEIRNTIDTPLSHVIVGEYLERNQNHREKIDHVYRIMRMQTDSIKEHLFNKTARMLRILDVEAVQFDQYELGDINDQKTEITLDATKLYLVDFWFVRCPPCLADHKRIAKNYAIFEENNIELIGVSRDDTFNLWKRYLDKHDYPWVNVREQKPEKRLTYDLSIWAYPTYALIDHKGSIQARFRSFAEFENYINKK
ncbi:TlpA disulfide reductase family protein [uncultured Dokdonia sp.]|uniref:TlpA family protein disulfide reductase n=1 Tax=uncultured Dokdonia sp. TaxID=575653 RepID=UPI002609FF5C|nr:TlpA disulfide reductase family protein [uncultured Dokdonia sp.]